MTKKIVFRFLSFLIIGYWFLPIVFLNIPIMGFGVGIELAFAIAIVIFEPKIYLKTEMIYLYLLILCYILFAPQEFNNLDSHWFGGRIRPLFLGVGLYLVYFKGVSDNKGLKYIFIFALMSMFLSSITTNIGLIYFPTASRDLASVVFGDIEKANFYKKLGIIGYGYITSLAYIVPIFILFLKDTNWQNPLILFLIILLAYTVIIAQFTTQFLLFFISIGLSMMITRNRIKINIILLFVLLILIISVPSSVWAGIIEKIALIVPGSTLSLRLMDIVNTIEFGDINMADTHVAYRYERIPFIFNEIIKNPFFGGGESTGHLFWLDHLSLFGIIGSLPFFLLLRSIFFTIAKLLSSLSFYYFSAFIVFVLLGFMKNSGNREQYIVLFFLLPAGLYLYENGLIFINWSKLNYVKRIKTEQISL